MAFTSQMDSVLRKQLSVIILVTVVGLVTGYLLMSNVRNSASVLSVDAFSWLVFLIPCAIMLVGSFIVAVTATEIGRQLYIACVVICVVTGIASMVLATNWMNDPAIATQLLANSPEGAIVVTPLASIVFMIRDFAAFVVVPTVGNIAGAWVGSRLHPMTAQSSGKKKKRRK